MATHKGSEGTIKVGSNAVAELLSYSITENVDRIGVQVPPMGKVSMMFVTEKQYGLARNFDGRVRAGTEKKPDQLALF